MLGELHRRDPHPTGRRVHQQPLALLHACQIDEAVVGGQVDDRHRRRTCERPALGDRHEQPSIGDGDRPKRPVEQPHHAVADRQILDARANLQHHARALAADHLLLAGVHPQDRQHIAEVHSRDAHRHAHLAHAERSGVGAVSVLDDAQILERTTIAGES